jgi:hypothetical protein
VAVDLLTKGPVLDAGARGFVFSKWFSERGHEAYACDPSPDIVVPEYVHHFDRVALASRKWPLHVGLNLEGDPGAWYVVPAMYRHPAKVVPTWNLHVNWGWTERNPWDVIKLNIEGAEYDILDDFPGPIARQIVVSFHEHTPRARGRAECDRLIAKMGQWYKAFNVVWEKRYCCSENYWDVLFIRNDLV